MNLFSFFKFRMNLEEPSGLGVKKKDDKNCPSCSLQYSTAPFSKSLLISNSIFCDSAFEKEYLGSTSCLGVSSKVTLKPVMAPSTKSSVVMHYHLSTKYFSLPANLLPTSTCLF